MEPCSRLAAAEPLVGTAPEVHTWLIVEQAGPWSSHAPQTIEEFAALKGSGIMPLFARRPHARTHGNHFWIGRSNVLYEGSHASARELVEMAQDMALESNTDEPVMFVCTNGARDACCATIGRHVAISLEDDAVWECTHLGGHRFAATALILPSGNVYGRLNAVDARDALERERRGEYKTTHLRGRSYLGRREQAEQILGSENLEEFPLPARPESCGKDPVPGSYFAISRSSSR